MRGLRPMSPRTTTAALPFFFSVDPIITRVTSYPPRLGVLFARFSACIVREGFDPSTDGNSPELGGGRPQPQLSTTSAAGRRRLLSPEEPRRDQKEFETELLLCLQGEKRGMGRRVEIFLRCRYVDRPLTGGSARYRAVPPKIDHQRSIEGEKGKKKKRKRKKKEKRSTNFPAPSSSARRRRPRVASAFSPARGDGMSPRVGRKVEATQIPDGEATMWTVVLKTAKGNLTSILS
ncbi:hypothetical protein BHM03_00023864 [Ensete ventricosum]|nr:hypothetical protein BHM03_00023864 [Ensete ventricosum]